MRAVGEFCVHPGQGVCLVENVVSEPIPAYILSPIGQKHPVQIVFPLDQEFRLRDLMTHDEATNLVETPLVLLKRLGLALITHAHSIRNHPFLTREYLRWLAIVVCTSLLRR